MNLTYVCLLGKNTETVLNKSVFSACPNIKTLVLGDSVDLANPIGFCFSNSNDIFTVISLSKYPIAFMSRHFASAVYSKAVLYVPKNTKTLYQNTTGWISFNHIVEMETDETIKDVVSGLTSANKEDAVGIAYYSIDGKRLDQPIKGINIIKLSNGKTEKIFMK